MAYDILFEGLPGTRMPGLQRWDHWVERPAERPQLPRGGWQRRDPSCPDFWVQEVFHPMAVPDDLEPRIPRVRWPGASPRWPSEVLPPRCADFHPPGFLPSSWLTPGEPPRDRLERPALRSQPCPDWRGWSSPVSPAQTVTWCEERSPRPRWVLRRPSWLPDFNPFSSEWRQMTATSPTPPCVCECYCELPAPKGPAGPSGDMSFHVVHGAPSAVPPPLNCPSPADPPPRRMCDHFVAQGCGRANSQAAGAAPSRSGPAPARPPTTIHASTGADLTINVLMPAQQPATNGNAEPSTGDLQPAANPPTGGGSGPAPTKPAAKPQAPSLGESPATGTEPAFPQPAPKPATPEFSIRISVDGGGRLPHEQGDDGKRIYHWIRKSSHQSDREKRKAAAEHTREICKAGGYQFGDEPVGLNHVQSMLEGTRIVWRADAPPSASAEATAAEWHFGALNSLLETAGRLAKNGYHVIAVNAASAYHAGGGFQTGGRHALEESICMRSTLFESLEKAETLAKEQQVTAPSRCDPPRFEGREWTCHIPETGCIVSPDVEVFRGCTDDGYPFYSARQVAKMTIISVAMPNRNAEVRDAPMDAPEGEEARQTLILQKFRTLLWSAYSDLVQRGQGKKAALVIPDVGCGVYGNSLEPPTRWI
eukprot:s237_g24.t2